MKNLVLIACSGQKLDGPAPVRDLYQGQLFKGSVLCAEAAGMPWAVLSAKHGLVLPNDLLAPYEQRMSKNRAAQRDWAVGVACQILAPAARPDAVVFLAGKDYRFHLKGLLEAAGVTTYAPLEGLSIGRQLARLKTLSLGNAH